MDYKKKYEDAFEKAKEVYNRKDATNGGKLILESIFPELKESDDEKTKNLIYCLIRDRSDNWKLLEYNGCSVEKALAWLEKQGEKSDYNPYKETVKSISIMVKKYARFGSDLQDFYNNVKVKCKDAIEYDKTFLENQDEQKPADKIVPKFKVGDCIVEPRQDEPEHLWHINRIKDDCYWRDASSAGIKIAYADKECRLWTIQDAKDGDVLVCSCKYHGGKLKQVGVFKEYLGKYGGCSNSFKIYAGIDWDKHLLIDSVMGSSEIHPATKEQRDLLFTKMKDAGYEWDEEKKELKKIEQKPEITDDVLSRFAFYQYDDDTIYLSSLFVRESDRGHGYGSKVLKAAEEVAKTFGISKIRLKVERNTWMEEWYKKNGYEYLSSEGKYDWLENKVIDIKLDKIEHKPVWSEEDEKIRQDIENLIHFALRDGSAVCPAADTTKEDAISWIQSLKERYGWKPSDESSHCSS